MREALSQAELANEIDEVPVGAVIVKDSKIIGAGFNQNIVLNSVMAHAEMIAINNASNFLKNYSWIVVIEQDNCNKRIDHDWLLLLLDQR